MKPGGRYRKGYRREKQSRAWLESWGYLVIEARGSHGLWDLVGIHHKDGSVVLVQVKSNKKPGPKEMQALRDFCTPYGGAKWAHVWHDREGLEVIPV